MSKRTGRVCRNETNRVSADLLVVPTAAERFAELRADFRAALAKLEGGLIARIGLAETRQTRFNLGAWIALLGAIAALMKL